MLFLFTRLKDTITTEILVFCFFRELQCFFATASGHQVVYTQCPAVEHLPNIKFFYPKYSIYTILTYPRRCSSCLQGLSVRLPPKYWCFAKNGNVFHELIACENSRPSSLPAQVAFRVKRLSGRSEEGQLGSRIFKLYHLWR